MKIILGSSSPFRRKLLENAGIAFEVVKPELDEQNIRTLDPLLTPIVLSYAKAKAVAGKVSQDAIIIACDQVVLCNGEMLEKPKTADDVRKWYKIYAQYPVNYINGITVLNTANGKSLTFQDISISDFKPIPEEFMERQIKEGTIFKCCGGIGDATDDAYGTIRQGAKDSVIGVPIQKTFEMIERIK